MRRVYVHCSPNVQVSPHHEEVELRPQLKASLAALHAKLNDESSVPAVSSYPSPSSSSSSPSSSSPSSPSSSVSLSSSGVVDHESENIISSLTLYSDLPGGSVGSHAPSTVAPADTVTAFTTTAGDEQEEIGEPDANAAASNAGFNDPTSVRTSNTNRPSTSPGNLTCSDCNGALSSSPSLSTTNTNTNTVAVVSGDSSTSSSNKGIINKNKNRVHDEYDGNEDDGDIDRSKDNTEPGQASSASTVFPSPRGNERSDCSTAQPIDHDHHDRDIDIDTSGEVYPEPLKVTSTKPVTSLSPTALNAPTGAGSATAEASGGRGTKTQGGRVRSEHSTGKKAYFDLAMALDRKNGVPDHRGESSGSCGADAMDGSWAKTRSVSDRRRTDDDGSSVSSRPEHVITVRSDELKGFLLPPLSTRPAGGNAKDGLSTVVGKLSATTASSSMLSAGTARRTACSVFAGRPHRC